ncbi:hypothetical protein [Streptomyces sp. NPDC058542]|uniref:hypothetical protein n=1 Tax=Streptomyces sp. NPDC058542 TaxID=3346543 RepID=UPI003650C1F5
MDRRPAAYAVCIEGGRVLLAPAVGPGGERGPSDVLLQQRRYAGGADEEADQLFFMDALVE